MQVPQGAVQEHTQHLVDVSLYKMSFHFDLVYASHDLDVVRKYQPCRVPQFGFVCSVPG